MMTGVETAGLILAAFPLVVNGLGSYVAGANTLRMSDFFGSQICGIVDE
jgi:hypothetical protein